MDRLVVEHKGGVIVVAGEVDASTVGTFNQAVGSSSGDIVVDLSNCTFMDSTGITALIDADMLARSRNAGLVLVDPSTVVRRVLAVCGMSETFAISVDPHDFA